MSEPHEPHDSSEHGNETSSGAETGTSSPAESPEPTRTQQFFHDLFSGSWLVSLLAIVVALIIGAVFIAVADPATQRAAGYFFDRPSDFFANAWGAIADAYQALFRGAIIDPQADTFVRLVRPLTETLVFSVPLILAGLGLAVGFRAGLFNIGGQGQIIVGAIVSSYIGFAFDLPVGLHLLLALFGGVLAGAIWAFIPGFLRARTGAHEVIVTIMLNSIASYLLAYLLTTSVFREPGSPYPESPPISEGTASYPALLGGDFRLHAGFLVAIAATIVVWWLMERSTLGFEIRAAGTNPNAARTAGISVGRVIVLTMVISGILTGLAGASQIVGTERTLTTGVAGSYGFDAITVALLGRNRPWGTFFAGLLFGAFKAGSFLMQSTTPMPIDLILVVQSVIVLLIAAPPLVRAIFRLPSPGSRPRSVAGATRKKAAA
ncbi:MAG TPA: ABC transporter permease [Ruania sp.]|nr:ABC transporter permease [Ruania sp.]